MWKRVLTALGLPATAVALGYPIRSNVASWRTSCVQGGGDAFVRITPTTTAVHYSPFNTGVAFASDDDWRIELEFRYNGEPIGTWGTVFGNTGQNHSTGLQVRQYNANKSFLVYLPMIDSAGNTGTNTKYFPQEDDFVVLVVDTTRAYPNFLTFGDFVGTWEGWFFNHDRWTVANPLYIGEGPRGYGATIATDWKRVTIWKNGVLVKDYVPHRDGCFFDTVSGELLQKDPRSNTKVEYIEE